MARFGNLAYDNNETIVRTGDSIISHVTQDGNTTRETVVKTARRVADHVTQDGNTTRDHVDQQHEQTRRHSDDNATYIVDQLGGRISGWQIFVSAIIAILAGVGTWAASKGYIVKDILDAAGNPVRTEPYIPYISLLIVVAVVAAFFVSATILSFFGRRR